MEFKKETGKKSINLKAPNKTINGNNTSKDINKKIGITDEKKIISKTKNKNTVTKERISTGVPKLDQMISGGFTPQSINIVEGGSGSGKTIIAMQYLFEGLKRGETTMYVTFEEKKENFYNNMKKLGWDLEKAENSKKFIFLEYSPEKVKMMLDEGGGAIESLVLKHNVKRMVIDSITSFALLFDNLLEKRAANLGLFNIIRKWECTTLFTVQHDPSTKKSKDIELLEFEVDGIILLYYDKINNERRRLIEIMKMRRTKHSNKVYSFSIENGIKINNVQNISIPKKTNKNKK